jgi:hypothetical protein
MGIALALLVLIVVPTVWATWRVSGSTLPLHRKTVLIIGAWIVPLVGAHIALRELQPAQSAPAAPDPATPAKTRHVPPPTTVVLPGQEPFSIQDHLFEGTGPPILDFQALDDWAGQAATPELAGAARQAGHHAWLLHFREWLGDGAHLTDAHGCWVLSDYAQGVASAAARFMAASRGRILELLDGVAKFPDERGTLITLDDEVYYHYVANYYPEEGEFAFSSGMFINAGCQHFVALRCDLSQLEPVIAHEMTHFGLAHLSLPLWLDEGLAVNTEHQISSSYRHPATAVEMIPEHHAFWTEQTIQEFWSGSSFHRADEGQKLSYDLARAIVELIGRDWAKFTRFATSARRDDGGAAAAVAELQLELGDLAAAAINARPKGSWAPKPDSWEGVAVKARR